MYPGVPVLVLLIVLVCVGHLIRIGHEAESAVVITLAAGLGAVEIVRRLRVVTTS